MFWHYWILCKYLAHKNFLSWAVYTILLLLFNWLTLICGLSKWYILSSYFCKVSFHRSGLSSALVSTMFNLNNIFKNALRLINWALHMCLGIVSPDKVWKLNKTVCFVSCSYLCGLVHSKESKVWCKEAII